MSKTIIICAKATKVVRHLQRVQYVIVHSKIG